MKQAFIFLFVLCSLSAFAQPTLQDTTRFLVFDPVKSFVTTGAGIRAHSIGNSFTSFTGPTTTVKTFTLPNASATILTSNAAVTVAQGGTGTSSTLTGILQGGSPFSAVTSSTVGQVLRVTGANTFAFGAVDLADTDAVTGVLPAANGGNETTTGRATGQTAANANIVTVTVGGADASYIVSGTVLVTTSNSEVFNITVDYTDEGNTARTAVVPLTRHLSGDIFTGVNNILGAVPYPGISLHIRCKASTDIVIKTAGTFTGCTYNVEGRITKI